MSVVTLKDRLNEDRRLVILRLLAETPEYRLNESTMAVALEDFGHPVSRDQVRTDFAWLAEQGLVNLEELVEIKIATATVRGLDVAAGRAIVPGVRRPSPK
jgi:Fe2+ or Zn2+ uptake regulation protein